MERNNMKVSNLYGRARRIELVEKIVYVVIGIVAVILVIFLVSRQTTSQEKNVNFAYLRDYLEAKGFSCSQIHISGGQCVLSRDNSSYLFIRRDDGFEYIINTKSYILGMRHFLNEEDVISFKTYSDAFSGYRNKNYACSYDKNILGELGSCIDEDSGSLLDLESYRGVILQAMNDLNNIIDSSGYNKQELIENYRWQKK